MRRAADDPGRIVIGPRAQPLMISRMAETPSLRRTLAGLHRYRHLLRNLVLKDLKLKYRGSVIGFLWSLANPLSDGRRLHRGLPLHPGDSQRGVRLLPDAGSPGVDVFRELRGHVDRHPSRTMADWSRASGSRGRFCRPLRCSSTSRSTVLNVAVILPLMLAYYRRRAHHADAALSRSSSDCSWCSRSAWRSCWRPRPRFSATCVTWSRSPSRFFSG